MALSSRDMEDLRPLLSDTVQSMLGFSEPTVVAAALNCVSAGHDLNKTVDQLSGILDGSQATTLAQRVHMLYEDFKSKSKSSKRRRKHDIESEDGMKRRRYLEDKDDLEISEVNVSAAPAPAKPKNTLPNIFPAGSQLTPDKIKEMMMNAQKMIQERKAQLGATLGSSAAPTPTGGALLPTPNLPPPGMGMPGAPGMVRPTSLGSSQAHIQAQPQLNAAAPQDAKARRAQELQAQIQARLSSIASTGLPPPLIPGLQGPPPPGVPIQRNFGQPLAGPSPLILNAEGKTIDAKTGEVVQLTSYKPTLKANISAKKREQFKGLIEQPAEEISDSKFFDPRVSLNAFQRQKRSFKFHERGKFEQQAVRLRAKAQLERLQAEIAQAAKKTGIASAAKIATITPKKEIKEGEVPDIEWWDSIILGIDSYGDLGSDGEVDEKQLGSITNLVEHPTQMAPPVEPKDDVSIPVYLTKKERKKLRRQNRREAEKEVQEKIRLGLAPPLEPKVRMANLMRVLGTEAVQDPTKVEAHVRAQMAKRQRQHEEANAARKLTVEQRRDKRVGKLKEDTSQGVLVSVYRVRDLSDPAIKFKVEKNASQLYMTGLTVIYRDCNLVVVEGGPKQQRKFRRLMLHRIKWAESRTRRGKREEEEEESDEEGDGEDKTNKCVLVWEGTVKTRSFDEMRLKVCPTESFAREQLKKVGVEHYWDLAFSGTVLEMAADEG